MKIAYFWEAKHENMVQKEYIDFLVNLGKSGVNIEQELKEKGLTNRHYLSNEWKELNDTDLISFFKGLVLAEEFWFSNGEHIGSTTDTKFVYNEIRDRALDNDYSLGNWAFQYSSNEYVPVDSGNRHGAKTIQELNQWWRDYDSRNKADQEAAIKRKEEKRRLKAEAHAERLRKKAIRDKELGYK